MNPESNPPNGDGLQGGDGPRRGEGLRPSTPAACREFLLALGDGHAVHDHAQACKSCASHAAFRASIAKALCRRPTPPAALSAPTAIEAIHERIVDGIETASALTPWISGEISRLGTIEMPSPEWPEPLLDSAIARAVASAPQSPTVHDWAGVQQSLIATLGARRLARTRFSLWIGAVGIAASAMFAFLLPAVGTKKAPTIVFVDLASAPSTDYPWFGAPR